MRRSDWTPCSGEPPREAATPELLDISRWPSVDVNALEDKARLRYQQRVAAVEHYAAGVALGEIESKTEIHRRILYRMIERALRNLVYSAHSIAQIAYQVGFNDPAYFSRFFTQHVGEPPAQFRASRAFGNPTI